MAFFSLIVMLVLFISIRFCAVFSQGDFLIISFRNISNIEAKGTQTYLTSWTLETGVCVHVCVLMKDIHTYVRTCMKGTQTYLTSRTLEIGACVHVCILMKDIHTYVRTYIHICMYNPLAYCLSHSSWDLVVFPSATSCNCCCCACSC